MPSDSKKDLEEFLKSWLNDYINSELGDLINLSKINFKSQYLRALIFQIYENNGILKRRNVENTVKLISKDERKELWKMGIKLGRYHIYLPKMLKPKAVKLRITLWKLFNKISSSDKIPQSGLNFLIDKKFNKKFLLLCGFENFKDFFVRVDILEKLFMSILNKTNNRKFKVSSEMMNLLGCSKENFYKLMELMNYKKGKEIDTYIFFGDLKNKKNIKIKNISSPFKKLLNLNLK